MGTYAEARVTAQALNVLKDRQKAAQAKADTLGQEALAKAAELSGLLPEGHTLSEPDENGHVFVIRPAVRRPDLIEAVRAWAKEHEDKGGWDKVLKGTDAEVQEIIGDSKTERGAIWQASQVAKAGRPEPAPEPEKAAEDGEPEGKPAKGRGSKAPAKEKAASAA